MSPIIEVKDLAKRFGRIDALAGANLEIYESSIHGLFGANGAGKSTMIRILTGVTEADKGLVKVNGIDVRAEPTRARSVCTPVVEIPHLYSYMRLYDLLQVYCEMAGIKKENIEDSIEKAMKLTGTVNIVDKKFGKMSLGQQHRCEVARAIATARNVLLMDEPFIGIDIDTKRSLKAHFRKWVKEEPKRAIIFTSHNLMENEGFVDRITFLMNGKTVETGTVDHFRKKYLKPSYSLEVDDPEKSIIILQKLNGVKVEKNEGFTIMVSLDDQDIIKDVTRELSVNGIGLLEVHREGSVEDVFSHFSGVTQ